MTLSRAATVIAIASILVAWEPTPKHLVYPPYPPGYAPQAGVLIPGEVGQQTYALHWLSRGTHSELWLGRSLLSSPTPAWELQDSLVLPAHPRSQSIVMTDCSMNGTADFELIALVRTVDADSFHTIIRAWRANREAGRFQRISVRGIVCRNEGYGT